MNANRLKPCIDLPLEQEELKETINKAKDWALMHGISMRSKDSYNTDQVQLLPFTLLPSTIPRQKFEVAKGIQVLLNELMHKVAHNKKFLTSSLESTIQADPFTAELFKIYETVYNEGYAQELSLGLLRSDYMLHGASADKLKQIEFNTIASSFGGIAPIITEYHKYMLAELGHRDKLENIPENNSITGLCKGLVKAWSLYNNEKAVILFVVENVTYNISDQRFHEFEVRRLNSNIKIIRRSLKNLVSSATLGPKKELIVDDMEVSVVYFRSGYEVEAYPTDREWSVRLLIERSRAIKCPSIQYHLAGTKKVQQSLAQPGALDQFFSETDKIMQIQEVFAGLYSLEFTEEGDEIIKKAIADPSKYVLKPQREGGGNNVYNDDIKTYLNNMQNSVERKAWILMDRICPPVQANYIVQRNKQESSIDPSISSADIVSELGVYGVLIGSQDSILHNEEVGHILRSKLMTENEGGVAAGIGALDSPYLIS